MENKEIKLNKEELLQLINKKFTPVQLEDFVNKKYIHKDDIDLYDFNDDEIIEEVENRNWSNYEAKNIYNAISSDLRLDKDDVYYHLDQLNHKEQYVLVKSLNSSVLSLIKVDTLYDEMKSKIIIELYNKLTLDQLEILKNTLI